jgi:hypothetical protein
MAKDITYANLDRLLTAMSFDRRVLSDKHVAYVDEMLEPIFVFPNLPAAESVWPHHLAAVRHWLLTKELITEEAFDQWQCQIRFGDECGEPIAVGAANSRTTSNISTT